MVALLETFWIEVLFPSILIKFAIMFSPADAHGTQNLLMCVSLNGSNICNVLLMSIRNAYNSENVL